MGLISNGTTIFDNGSMASGFGGSLNFISKATASASASIEFTSGIDSTYKEYVFYFVNMHPSTDGVRFVFNMSTDGGSNYNVTKTTTFFRARHREDGTNGSLSYDPGGDDIAQGTGFQTLASIVGADNDQCLVGTLHLFNPSSTTFVKHFLATTNTYRSSDYSAEEFIAGYGNTTSAINGVKFQMDSGNIDAGEILLFGIN
jgi:hypothetical protein